MKLVKSMDAGPIYHQETIKFDATNLPTKDDIYQTLATSGAKWLNAHLEDLPTSTPQNDAFATFTSKLNKTFSPLKPDSKPAHVLLNEIRAFYGFPKSTYTFFNTECIILSAHILKADSYNTSKKELSLLCSDGDYLVIDKLQPLGRKPMDAKSFLNGYTK